MADFTVATGSDHNVLNWERRVEREALKMAKFPRFWGTGPNAGIRVVDELGKGAGDTVYTSLVMNLTGSGVSGDSNLQGQEEDLVLHRQTLIIDQLRNAVKSAGKITLQRTFINFREEAGQVLSKWWADANDKWSANQLAGNTGESDTNLTGMQAPTAPTSATGNSRIIYGPSTSTTEASLSASSGLAFQLTMLDKAVTTAETSTPFISPIQTGSGPKYVAVLHPYQIYYLKTDATAARVTWYDYNKAKIQGGATGSKDIIGNPEFGALGEYNNVLIHADSRMPLAPSTTRVRRAVFFGSQAGVAAFGKRGGTLNRAQQIMQTEDYENRTGVGVAVIGGMRKSVYNSIDHGVIVMASYAAAP